MDDGTILIHIDHTTHTHTHEHIATLLVKMGERDALTQGRQPKLKTKIDKENKLVSLN